MTTLTINFDPETSDRFPVYRKYACQSLPQPAYLELDTRTGELSADYSGEIGNAVPAAVWHNLVLRFTLPAITHKNDIADAITRHTSDFQAILDGADVEWNGNNHVGVFSESAQNAIDRLIHAFELCFEYDHFQRFIIDDVAEWLNGDVWPTPGQSIDDFIDLLLQCDGDNDGWFTDDLADNPDAMKDAMLDIWADCLYSGDEIPAEIAKALLEAGTCDDSEWMEELTEFANAR